eukprot:538383-Amphidinium_carterae.1
MEVVPSVPSGLFLSMAGIGPAIFRLFMGVVPAICPRRSGGSCSTLCPFPSGLFLSIAAGGSFFPTRLAV